MPTSEYAPFLSSPLRPIGPQEDSNSWTEDVSTDQTGVFFFKVWISLSLSRPSPLVLSVEWWCVYSVMCLMWCVFIVVYLVVTCDLYGVSCMAGYVCLEWCVATCVLCGVWWRGVIPFCRLTLVSVFFLGARQTRSWSVRGFALEASHREV